MQLSRSLRWLLSALLLSVLTASAHAGVLISVGFAPPPLPVYEQPPCPEAGLMWTPGYWAYGDNGYYWVPGTWVPAPQPGFLWTPHYWGWEGGRYIFHEGYWGPHVGYYGGVNYGFGYGGIGFAGGEWRGGHFAYNTAVMHVGFHGGLTFVDRGRVDRGFVARDSHVAFSGGPGGIRHEPGPEERAAEHERHVGRTSFQQQHESTARADKTSYAKSNGGHPANAAVSRPMGSSGHTASATHTTTMSHTTTTSHTVTASHTTTMSHNATAAHTPTTASHTATAAHTPTTASHTTTAGHTASASHSMATSHSTPASHSAPQSHPASHPAPQSHSGSNGQHKH